MAKRPNSTLPRLRIAPELDALLLQALEEDVGSGDVTSLATIPEKQRGAGVIFSKEPGVLCGVDVARRVLRLANPRARMRVLARDGQELRRGREIARVEGAMRSILTTERLMLNFLQRMSGVATLTRR